MQFHSKITLIFSLFCTLFFSHIALADSLHIRHAKINPTVPGMKVTAAYFHIHNETNEDIKLVNVTSEVSDRVEIHEHTMKDGLMKMQHVKEGIAIPANDSAILKPGGYHIMIMNLKKSIPEGSTVKLELTFDNGSKQILDVEATKPTTMSHHH